MSTVVGLSPFHLQRIFKKVTGVSPREYVEAARIRHLKMSLKRGESIRKSTYQSGYNTSSWLYSKPDAKLGMSPATYKTGGQGAHIGYVIADCRLGRVLVAGTDRGICAVGIADSDEKLKAFLQAEYPSGEITNERNQKSSLGIWVQRILGYLSNDKNIDLATLPLDIQGTAFQMRVWKELQSIPRGSVVSYSTVASRVGVPRGSRAVANACASNPTPLVIPCHRVVRKNGDMGGYRWGINRKEELLKSERDSLAKE